MMIRALKPLGCALTGAMLSLAKPLWAEQRPVVVELFTSQGCSSCPPADEMFLALSEREDVIAIALHVDYWDYIGWADEYAVPGHADRQRAYAQTAGRRSIYTPEIIVNGETDIVGAKPMALSKAIAEHKEAPRSIDLELTRDGDTLSVRAEALADLAGPMEVHLVRLMPTQTSEITRGENSGKTIEYSNIAYNWRAIGTWDGASELAVTASVEGTDPVVVLVQDAGAGAIRAAAILD
ncbi:DUF1223 domain-containing protein [Sulfitobacter sp. HNIBRBA3233]|uniref:DUF1223 domain-containing protein n=1 Tax=Sulfitobacter marinivivus TaxID=3158558 RepID=UPI0032E03A8C